MKIKLEEIIEISDKYIKVQKKGGYYSRLDNFCKIYDYFFIKLNNYIKGNYKNKDKDEIELVLNKNILNVSNDKYTIIEIIKPNHYFGKRIILMPNFYDIIYFEILGNKIIKEFFNIISKNNKFDKYLINKKFLGFAHRINYKSEKIFYENYIEGWKDYEDKKDLLLQKQKFYLKSDLKSFYDEISHNNLIYLIKNFLELNSYNLNIEYLNYLLFEFNNILLKISGFSQKGIPQGLLISDIISQLYLWLIFYFEDIDMKSDFKYDKGIIKLEIGKVQIINYSDDLFFVSNSEKSLYKGFKMLENILNRNKLFLNLSKTSKILKKETFSKLEINIIKIKNDNIDEIKKMFDIFLTEIKKEFLEINLEKIKTLFKFFYKIDLLKLEEQKKIIVKIKKYINLNKKEIEYFKKIAILLVISSSNFGKLLDKLFLFKNSKENLEDNFINNFIENSNLFITDIHLLFLYRYLDSNKIKEKIKEKININNFLIKDFYIEKLKLKKVFLHNKFYGLNNIFYNNKIQKENEIGIKLENLFNIDINLTNKIFIDEYFLKNIILLNSEKKDNISLQIIKSLNLILDNLLFIKKIHKHFYLENSSFIADFHSLLNILLTILYSLEESTYSIVKISSKKGVLNNKNNNSVNYLNRLKSIMDNYGDFIVYIVEYRAKLNHKEIDKNITQNLKTNNFSNYNILFLHMKSILNDILKEINDIYEITIELKN